MFVGLPCLLSRGGLTAARGFERRHTIATFAQVSVREDLASGERCGQRRQFGGSRCEKKKRAAVECPCGAVRPPSANRERTLGSPQYVARSHQTYSTVYMSLCIQTIKAAWWRVPRQSGQSEGSPADAQRQYLGSPSPTDENATM